MYFSLQLIAFCLVFSAIWSVDFVKNDATPHNTVLEELAIPS